MCPQLLHKNWTIGTVTFSGCVLPLSSTTGVETISPPSHPCIEQYGQSGTTPLSLKKRRAFSICSSLSGMLLAPFLGTMLHGLHRVRPWFYRARLKAGSLPRPSATSVSQGYPKFMRLLPPMASTICPPFSRSMVSAAFLRHPHDVRSYPTSRPRRDPHAVSGAGVCAGQRPTAETRIKDKLFGRHALYLRRAFHVSQLAPVVVAARFATKPAEEYVTRSLHQPLAGHHAVSLVLKNTPREIRFQHRSLCLLHLEEQGIIFVATL